GDFTQFNGETRNRIALLNDTGSTTLFNSVAGLSAGVKGMGIVTNTALTNIVGKVVVAGDFTFFNGAIRGGVARLNLDGTLDVTFNPINAAGTISGANGSVNAVVVQGDGKVVIGGSFTSVNGTARNRIARLNVDGSLDANFLGSGAN